MPSPDGSAVRTFYNRWWVATIDENGPMVIRENDPFGRPVRVKEYSDTFAAPDWAAPPYAVTAYTYDVRDLLTGVEDAAGNRTTISYSLTATLSKARPGAHCSTR